MGSIRGDKNGTIRGSALRAAHSAQSLLNTNKRRNVTDESSDDLAPSQKADQRTSGQSLKADAKLEVPMHAFQLKKSAVASRQDHLTNLPKSIPYNSFNTGSTTTASAVLSRGPRGSYCQFSLADDAVRSSTDLPLKTNKGISFNPAAQFRNLAA